MTLKIVDQLSPNFNDRRSPLRYIMLHYTGMETGQVAIERLCDPDAQVSAHYVVEENGSILRLVPDEKRAWHAGVGEWRGETDMNSASVGIEIVNGGHDFGLPDYPTQQVNAVIALVRDIQTRHGVSPLDVIGHSDIAPDRKADPGEHFPWSALEIAGVAEPVSSQGRARGEVSNLLTHIGYGRRYALVDRVRAFQRRFRQAAITGQVDAETDALIRRRAAQIV